MPSVKQANMMVSRVVLVMWLLACLGVCFVVEQPRGSLMEHHPRFEEFCIHFKVYRKCINMGEYLPDLSQHISYRGDTFISGSACMLPCMDSCMDE